MRRLLIPVSPMLLLFISAECCLEGLLGVRQPTYSVAWRTDCWGGGGGGGARSKTRMSRILEGAALEPTPHKSPAGTFRGVDSICNGG